MNLDNIDLVSVPHFQNLLQKLIKLCKNNDTKSDKNCLSKVYSFDVIGKICELPVNVELLYKKNENNSYILLLNITHHKIIYHEQIDNYRNCECIVLFNYILSDNVTLDILNIEYVNMLVNKIIFLLKNLNFSKLSQKLYLPTDDSIMENQYIFFKKLLNDLNISNISLNELKNICANCSKPTYPNYIYGDKEKKNLLCLVCLSKNFN